jgi:integrase
MILLRVCLGDAVQEGLLPENPAAGLVVKRVASADEGWTFLTAEEGTTVTTSPTIPEPERLFFTAAIFTGLRQGELLGLHWADVHLDGDRPELVVRYSHRGPTKSGKVRRVPVLDPVRRALARWRQICPRSDEGLVFPTPRGCRRQRGDDARWGDYHVPGKGKQPGYKTLVGITCRVRFHDLRHTCASHLVMGTWGTQWSLPEIAAMLGHSDVAVTQRYAHLSPDHLHRLAAATARDPRAGGLLGHDGSGSSPNSPVISLARPKRLELLTLRLVFGACERGESVL